LDPKKKNEQECIEYIAIQWKSTFELTGTHQNQNPTTNFNANVHTIFNRTPKTVAMTPLDGYGIPILRLNYKGHVKNTHIKAVLFRTTYL
jgi:hypothetical protein